MAGTYQEQADVLSILFASGAVATVADDAVDVLESPFAELPDEVAELLPNDVADRVREFLVDPDGYLFPIDDADPRKEILASLLRPLAVQGTDQDSEDDDELALTGAVGSKPPANSPKPSVDPPAPPADPRSRYLDGVEEAMSLPANPTISHKEDEPVSHPEPLEHAEPVPSTDSRETRGRTAAGQRVKTIGVDDASHGDHGEPAAKSHAVATPSSAPKLILAIGAAIGLIILSCGGSLWFVARIFS